MKVFGHRGAAGYIPENTIEGFLVAFGLGVDAVELDVVPTGDGVLIVRHEGNLELSTNIAELPEFQRVTLDSEGNPLWLVEHTVYSDVQSLSARERYPELRSISAEQDNLYRVPSLRDVFQYDGFKDKSLIVELKHAKYYQGLGLDMVSMLEEAVQSYGLPNNIKISVETFDWDILMQLKERLPDLELIYAIDAAHWDERSQGDLMSVNTSVGFLNNIRAEGVSSLAIGFDLMFTPEEAMSKSGLNRPNNFFDAATAAGIQVYGFTAADDRSGLQGINGNEYWDLIASSRLDGVFADQPDRLLRALGR